MNHPKLACLLTGNIGWCLARLVTVLNPLYFVTIGISLVAFYLIWTDYDTKSVVTDQIKGEPK
jgi:hypothetical protein